MPFPGRPVVLLADHAAVPPEAEDGAAGDRLVGAVRAGDGRPVLDERPVAVDDRLAETRIRGALVLERPARVAENALVPDGRVAERVRAEHALLGVDGAQGIGVVLTPGVLPGGGPATGGVPCLHEPSLPGRPPRLGAWTWTSCSSGRRARCRPPAGRRRRCSSAAAATGCSSTAAKGRS